MAAVKSRGECVAFTSGNQILLYNLLKGTKYMLHLPEIFNNAKNNSTEISAETSSKNGDKNVDQEEVTQTTEKKSSSAEDIDPNRTLSFAFSKSGRLFVVSDDRKQLHLYQKSDSDEEPTSWTLLSSRNVVRRSSCVLFTQDENEIILGDKSGDVYKFSAREPAQPGELMMGHLSVLLDMALVDNDRYLVTCDRDEKIRVSLFPNTYNIHCYCLGHTDFLTSLVYVAEAKVIISGGGDGTIRSWDLEGKPLHCLNHGVTISPGENTEGTNNNNAVNSNLDSTTNSKNSSNTNKENSNNIASVKCMTFDPCSKTLAVSFDQSTVLQLYKIEINGEHISEIRLCDQRQLPTRSWDIQFLTNSHLLVLSPHQESPVSLFDCSSPSDDNGESTISPKISECRLQQQPKLQKFLTAINSQWTFFEASLKIVSLISSLPKSKMDNMSDYLERKEQQIKKKFQPKGKRKNPDLEKSPGGRESSEKKAIKVSK